MRGEAGDDAEEILPPRLRPQPRAAGGAAGEGWSQAWSDRPSPAGQHGSWLQQCGLVRTLVLVGLREKILNNDKVKQKFLG